MSVTIRGTGFTTTLPNPALSNVQQAKNTLSLLRGKTGKKYTYVKSRRQSRVLWSFQLTLEKMLELRSFLENFRNDKITYTDFSGGTWFGYLKSNPAEFQVEGRDSINIEAINITLEFEGIKIYQSIDGVNVGAQVTYITITDGITLSETVIATYSHNCSGTDSLTVSNSTLTQTDFDARSASDDLEVSDLAVVVTQVSDDLDVDDETVRLSDYVKLSSDSLAVTELAEQNAEHSRVALDAVVITEGTAYNADGVDSLSVSEDNLIDPSYYLGTQDGNLLITQSGINLQKNR